MHIIRTHTHTHMTLFLADARAPSVLYHTHSFKNIYYRPFRAPYYTHTQCLRACVATHVKGTHTHMYARPLKPSKLIHAHKHKRTAATHSGNAIVVVGWLE